MDGDEIEGVLEPDEESEDQLKDASDSHQHLRNRERKPHAYHAKQNRMHEIERPTYIKDAPRRVFDTHVHYPWRERGSTLPIYSADGMLDMLAYNCQRLNIFKLCLLGRPGEGNALVETSTVRSLMVLGDCARRGG